MDTSELHYVTYDPDEMWQDMHMAYLEAGGDILYGGDEKENLLRAVLSIAVSLMARVDSALRMDTLTYATGDYLDLYGEKRNCPRIAATAATATARFTFRDGGTPKTYPAGDTALTADGVVLYHLAEDVVYTGYAATVEAVIECAEAGEIGNGLAAGAQLQMIESDNAVQSVVVLESASGGIDREDDETYRERIRTYGLSSVTTGTAAQYEAAVKAVSTLILDAKAVNDGPGIVGIYLILDDDADEEEVIDAVEAALSPEDVRPLTDDVDIQIAESVAYVLNVSVWYPANLNISDTIDAAIEEYQAWQDHKIGRAFNPSKLTAALYQLGATRVEYGDDDGIDGGGAKYTEIPARSHCSGTITVTKVVES